MNTGSGVQGKKMNRARIDGEMSFDDERFGQRICPKTLPLVHSVMTETFRLDTSAFIFTANEVDD